MAMGSRQNQLALAHLIVVRSIKTVRREDGERAIVHFIPKYIHTWPQLKANVEVEKKL